MTRYVLARPHLALALAIATTAGPSMAADATAHPAPLAPVTLQAVVGTDGKAGGAMCAPNVSGPICQAMTQTVEGWQFQPGTRDGKPEAMAVSLRLDVVPEPVEGGFRLRVRKADVAVVPAATASVEAKAKSPPAYPPDELRRNKEATVVVEWWFARDAAPPHAGKGWRDGREARKGDPFVAAAANAVRLWKEPPHSPEQLSYCVRMEFSLGHPSRPARESMLDTGACQPSFVSGFSPPRLLTPLGAAP